MSAGRQQFPVHIDARGELLVVEGAGVGFPIQRVFTVRGTSDQLPRGGHTPACRELLVLVTGKVSGRVHRASGEVDDFDLACAGDSVLIDPSDLVHYTLDAESLLLVLCDQPYGPAS